MGGTQYVGDVDTSSTASSEGRQLFYGGINFGDIAPPPSSVVKDTAPYIALIAVALIAFGAYALGR